MFRPLRLELPGALYHITSRGDGREPIYLDHYDCIAFLAIVAQVCDRYSWVCHSYCLMTNHLLIEKRAANLARGMRNLNSVYTQRFNRAAERARRKTSYLDGANLNRDVDLDVTLGSAEADKTLGH